MLLSGGTLTLSSPDKQMAVCLMLVCCRLALSPWTYLMFDSNYYTTVYGSHV